MPPKAPVLQPGHDGTADDQVGIAGGARHDALHCSRKRMRRNQKIIGIEEKHVFSGCGVQSLIHRVKYSSVMLVDSAYRIGARGPMIDDFAGPIRRTAVDADMFDDEIRSLQRNRGERVLDRRGCVQRYRDDRDQRGHGATDEPPAWRHSWSSTAP